jgi:hypothetical protein
MNIVADRESACCVAGLICTGFDGKSDGGRCAPTSQNELCSGKPNNPSAIIGGTCPLLLSGGSSSIPANFLARHNLFRRRLLGYCEVQVMAIRQ